MRWLPYALLGFLLLAAMSCTKLENAPPAEPGADEQPEQELFDATIHFYQNDLLSGTLKSGRIRKYARKSTVLLDSGVVMNFFNPQGQHTTKLTSDSGRADESKNDMVAMGHVVARSDSGQMLETKKLRWENRNRKIISDDSVRLTTETDTIHGIGFISDENLRNWEILRPYGRTFREFERREPRPSLTMPDSTAPRDSVP